jgi:hypothetical protein
MTTKAEIIELLKTEYPTLRTGSDEAGYVDLSTEEYEATIDQWADNQIAVQEAEQAAADKAAAREAVYAKLGLTADEIAALAD